MSARECLNCRNQGDKGTERFAEGWELWSRRGGLVAPATLSGLLRFVASGSRKEKRIFLPCVERKVKKIGFVWERKG